MKLMKHGLFILIASVSFSAIAAPIFTMTPVNLPSIVVEGKMTILSYQVTPNTTSVLNQANGVINNKISPAVATQLAPTSADDCVANETFTTHSSCILQLQIDATHLTAGQVITGKPIFCNHPELASPMYCSQPAAPLNIRVVSSDDPAVTAVTVTPNPNDSLSLYPGETQTLTVINTSGDSVNLISATTDATNDFTITNNCSGTLKQGAQCTLLLNTTLSPTINASDTLTIQANDYTPITAHVLISPVTVLAGSYINQTTYFEGLIWIKKTAWTRTLPTSLAAEPIIFFSVANEANDWLVIGTTHDGTPTPVPPTPPYSYQQHPVILESTDSAQTWNQITPALTLPQNATFMSSNIQNGLASLVGFDGSFTYNPTGSPVVSGDFVPLAMTRKNDLWANETVDFSAGSTAGAMMGVTADVSNHLYAVGTEIIRLLNYPLPYAAIWQREIDTHNSSHYKWNPLAYYAPKTSITSALLGLFFGVHTSQNTLIAVGMHLDVLNLKPFQASLVPLLIVGNVDTTHTPATWIWAQPTLPSTQIAPHRISELSSVSANPTPLSENDAYWVTVGYSATMTTVNKKTILSDTSPLLWFNTSKNGTDTKWTAVDLTHLVPSYERWQLSSVSWNGQEWIAVGIRYAQSAFTLFPLQPLIITSYDGITWTEVVNNLPQHSLSELVPLIFGIN